MRYHYQALNESGEEREGYFEADDKSRAAAQLRNQGLFVARLVEVDSEQPENRDTDDVRTVLMNLMPITTSRKVFFYRQLALLLESGISITESLSIITNMQRGRMKAILKQITISVQRGTTLSASLAKHEDIFSPIAVHMIRSAEASGEMDEAFRRIAENLERRAALKQQIISTMIYPVLTLLLSIGVFVFLMTGVIPKFADFFAKSGKPIPPETQRMIDLSDFMINNWPIILVVIVASGIILFLTYRDPKGRLQIDRLLLRIPVIGGAISAAAMSQFTWGMSTLIASGLSMVEALNIVMGLVKNQAVAFDIEQAKDCVLRGMSFSRGLKERRSITELIQHMTEVGERTGDLARILNQAGSFYERELQNRAKLIGTLAEPLAILLIGGMVGFIYFGFFKAIFALGAG